MSKSECDVKGDGVEVRPGPDCGIDLRDYFAASAAPYFLAAWLIHDQAARCCYAFADEMMKARGKQAK